VLAFFCSLPGALRGETRVTLTNGYTLQGITYPIVDLKNGARTAGGNGDPVGYPILMVDDGLKQVFVYKNGMVAGTADAADIAQRIDIWQKEARTSSALARVGARTWVTDFDAFGRRFVTTVTPEKTYQILQGITEINPRYARAVGLSTENAIEWDMRLATESLPSPTLNRIFEKSIDRDDLDGRLQVVNFYIAAERFSEARKELQAIMRQFPAAEGLDQRLKSLTQREARQILDEALLRRDAGQYGLALTMLNSLANVDGISRVIRLEASDRVAELSERGETAEKLLDQLEQQIAALPDEQRGDLADFVQVMRQEMTFDTLSRLSDYERLGKEAQIALENRVALALGGWLQGSGSGLQNLAVAKSLIAVRRLVSQYLASENAAERTQILAELRGMEGARPEYIAKLLPLLPPPLPLPQPVAEPADDRPRAADAPGATPPVDAANQDNPAEAEKAGEEQAAAAEEAGEAAAERPQLPGPGEGSDPPGYFEFEFESPRGTVRYSLQLPPEYHPLRKYPCVVALHPLGESPAAELSWWTGRYDPALQMRTGEASRRGYIVVAPQWSREGQAGYEFTPLEHHRVLAALRHAMRRASIDSDRVFLAGHLAGATAAWDIALAHPDTWAGLVAIGGRGAKYIMFYNANAKYVPMYFVTGELSANYSLLDNGPQWDDYMGPGYNAMVTLYHGHGDGFFYEDIKNMFDWMRLSAHRRGNPPSEIEVVSKRAGDQYFWWLEINQLRNVEVNPVIFDDVEHKTVAPFVARVGSGNLIRINQGPASSYNILLTPEMGIDLNQPVTIRVGGRNTTHEFAGGIEFMLEDARRRADRQQVYWDAVTVP
jgi:predicted esterase